METSGEKYEDMLALLRASIDDIDFQTGPIFGDYFSPRTIEEYRLTCAKLTSLYAGRMVLTAKVGELKAEHNVEPVQTGRYIEVARNYEHNRALYFPHINAIEFTGIVELIHDASLHQQNRIRNQGQTSSLSDVA